MIWQPISTFVAPPFDADRWYANVGRYLIFTTYVDTGTYSYTKKGVGRWRNGGGWICEPTHWMPLPEGPC